ncbi:hypothetical protein N7528_002204 [Penicillium herquei]|nr:hypothetical protein N7528_002204 [Penicillium herquei]
MSDWNRDIASDRQPLLHPSVDEDVSMVGSDSTHSQTEALYRPVSRPSSVTGDFSKYESRDRSFEAETYPAKRFGGPSRGVGKNDWAQRGQNSFHTSGLNSPTDMMMELSQVYRNTRFSQTVKRVFENSWVDKSKTCEFKMLYLFDIKIVPSRLSTQTPNTGEPSSHDRQLLSLLGDFPLRFYGVSRACHIGDRDHPKKLCGNDNCGICSAFKAQWKARRDNTPFESGPRIRASPQSSQADKYVTNDRVRSQQHAMILCACPGLVSCLDRNTLTLEALTDTFSGPIKQPKPPFKCGSYLLIIYIFHESYPSDWTDYVCEKGVESISVNIVPVWLSALALLFQCTGLDIRIDLKQSRKDSGDFFYVSSLKKPSQVTV